MHTETRLLLCIIPLLLIAPTTFVRAGEEAGRTVIVSASEVSSTPIEDSQSASLLNGWINEALSRNPSLAALRARTEAAREMVEPEGILPDPMVEFMVQDINFPSITIGDEEMSMAGIQVTQDFLYPGKLQKRKEAARSRIAIRGAELLGARTALVMQIRTLYAQLYAIDYEQKSIEMGRELLDMLTATVGVRYSAGEAEQEAVIKAQLEAIRLQEQAIDLTAERKTTAAAVNRLLDRPGDSPVDSIAALPDVNPTVESWKEAALARAPELQVRQAEVEAARRRLDVAESELNPNLSAGMGVFSRGGFDQVVTLQLGIELPLWRNRKQRPMMRAAQHEVEESRQMLKDTEAMIRSEIVRLQAEWSRANEQILLYREGILPQTSAALDAARASYLAGRGDYSTVVEDFNLWLEARVELNRREAERFSVWAELDALLNPIAETEQE